MFSGSMSINNELIEKIAGRKGAFGGKILSFNIEPFSKEIVKVYLNEKVPELKFSEGGFNRFFNCSKGIPFYVNTFANFLPENIELTETAIKNNFNNVLPFLAIHLTNEWNRLTFQEKKIIIAILENNIKRKDIANSLNVSTGSLSNSLVNLQKLNLIESNKDNYSISEPILIDWLKREYELTGFYPF